MRDITLSYSGGSGGFLLLHLLLLSGKFYTVFKNKRSLTDIIQSQWNIANHDEWKESEAWPDNNLTQLDTTSLRKLYFSVNPYQPDMLTSFPGKNLVLYTDIDSQLELAYFKKANWFIDYTSSFFTKKKIQSFKEKLLAWNIHYNNIKDPTWPKCLSHRHINRLPTAIQQEILESEYTQQFLNSADIVVKLQDLGKILEELLEIPTMNSKQHELIERWKKLHPQELLESEHTQQFLNIGSERVLYNYYKNELVYPPMLPFLNSADIVVKLQDVVNSNGKILEELLEIPTMNSKQHELIERWKKLHPQELLEQIGITPSS